MMCSTQTQPETARFTSHSLARAPPWQCWWIVAFFERSSCRNKTWWSLKPPRFAMEIHQKSFRYLASQNGFNDLASVSCSTQLPSFGNGNHHPVWWTQFLLVPPCLTLMVVSTRGCWSKAPQQDAKTQGLDTFEVYLGATVLAFNRKLSSPWLKCNKKPNKFFSTLPRMLSFDTWYPSWPRWWGKGYLMYPYGQSTLGP